MEIPEVAAYCGASLFTLALRQVVYEATGDEDKGAEDSSLVAKGLFSTGGLCEQIYRYKAVLSLQLRPERSDLR
jgi:hypothetical protein